MASKLNDDNDGPIAEINIVPFVDIILVVLIIFMVTTPLIIKPSISVNLPKAVSGEETTPSPFNVSVSPNGDIFLNGSATQLESLKTEAQNATQKNPNTQAIISADEMVSHGKVIGVIDAIKSGGVTKFAISTDKKK